MRHSNILISLHCIAMDEHVSTFLLKHLVNGAADIREFNHVIETLSRPDSYKNWILADDFLENMGYAGPTRADRIRVARRQLSGRKCQDFPYHKKKLKELIDVSHVYGGEIVNPMTTKLVP